MPSFATHAALASALLTGFGTLPAASASAQPGAGVASAPCTGPTQIAQTTWNSPAISVGGGKNPALGQSFTAPCTGSLRSLAFYVYLHPETGPIAVTVYGGAGRTGPVLSTATLNVTSTGWKTVTLPTPVPVTDGGVYTFVLTVPSGQNTHLALYTSSGNPYAGGSEYHALFGPFTGFAEDDLMFRVDIDATSVGVEDADHAGAFALGVASPNPTAVRAAVTLTVADARPVTVAAYDALGRRVAVVHDGPLAAGTHTLGVDTGSLVPGVYTLRAISGDETATQRLTVVR